ncbi:MAG: tetratricopeptide repeat protein [Myxococcota bacterium]
MTAPLLWLLLLAIPFRAAAAPPCASECKELKKKGELRPGVPVEDCTLRLCHEAARTLYQRDAFEEALKALDHIRDERAGSPSYELDRGLVLYALGRLDEAIESFDRVLEALATSLRAGTQRGHALARLGQLDEAKAQFERLRELPGASRELKGVRTSSYLLGAIGVIELRQGKLKKGKRDLEEALEDDGSNGLAATMLYKVVPSLESQDLSPEAIGLLERAYEEIALGRPKKGIAIFEKIVDRWPRYEVGWRILGQTYFARLDYRACEDVYRRAEKNLPKRTELGLERIRCTILRHGLGSQEAQAAVDELRRRAVSDPDNPRLKELLFALDL